MIYPLTSLRFFFALAVFLSHISISKEYPTVMRWFSEGFIGVGFFFVLSGFILAYNYQDKILSGYSFKSFYLARFARIYPVHFLTLLIALFIISAEQNRFFYQLFLIQSWSWNKQIFFSLNATSWSISTEAFFYACFPFLILLKRWIWIPFIILITAILAVNFFVPKGSQHYILYINPAMRTADFILGIMLFHVFKRTNIKVNTWHEILAIVILAIFFYFHRSLPISYRFSIYYWIPILVVLFTFSKSSGILSKILANKFWVYLGEASFSFYLLHFLVIKIIPANTVKGSLIAFSVTLILSALCFTFYEKPVNNMIRAWYMKRAH